MKADNGAVVSRAKMVPIQEFADIKNCSYWFVRKLLLEGKLPYVAVGRVKLIPLEAGLEAFSKLIVNVGA